MLQRFIDTFSKEAKGAGITRLEFYIKECWGQTVQVYKQEVERLNISQETLVYVEGSLRAAKDRLSWKPQHRCLTHQRTPWDYSPDSKIQQGTLSAPDLLCGKASSRRHCT